MCSSQDNAASRSSRRAKATLTTRSATPGSRLWLARWSVSSQAGGSGQVPLRIAVVSRPRRAAQAG